MSLNIPGVPPLLSAGGFAASITAPVALLVSDTILVAGIFTGPQWGIFDEAGNPVIVGDSVAGVEFRRDARISDFPVELGGFGSANKVQIPYDLRMTFMKGGVASFAGLANGLIPPGSIPGFTQDDSVSGRGSFLAQVDAVVNSTSVFHGVTPEVTYVNANPTHYDYRRTRENGATLLTVNVWLEEVRTTATATFSNTQQPSGADPVNGGTVQPAPAVTPGTPPM